MNNGKYVGGTSSTTFQALFHYFADPVCSNATLTVLASGHYSPGADSDRVQGATEFDFFVQSVVITVHDESTARNLNGLKVCSAIYAVLTINYNQHRLTYSTMPCRVTSAPWMAVGESIGRRT